MAKSAKRPLGWWISGPIRRCTAPTGNATAKAYLGCDPCRLCAIARRPPSRTVLLPSCLLGALHRGGFPGRLLATPDTRHRMTFAWLFPKCPAREALCFLLGLHSLYPVR